MHVTFFQLLSDFLFLTHTLKHRVYALPTEIEIGFVELDDVVFSRELPRLHRVVASPFRLSLLLSHHSCLNINVLEVRALRKDDVFEGRPVLVVLLQFACLDNYLLHFRVQLGHSLGRVVSIIVFCLVRMCFFLFLLERGGKHFPRELPFFFKWLFVKIRS